MKLYFNFVRPDPVLIQNRKLYSAWNICIEKGNMYYGSISGTDISHPVPLRGWKEYKLKKL